jgi:stearoyl-CoA desaturase (delta-9 desaturase)
MIGEDRPHVVHEDGQFLEFPDGTRRRLAVDSAYLHRIQRRHFLLYDVAPLLGAIVAVGLLPVLPIGAVDVGVFVLMWLVTGVGITVGFHRLFAHRAFKTNSAVRVALTIFGCMAARGPMISWAAMHRRHHERADREGDMHSPNLHGAGPWARLRGFGHAHLTWMARHAYPNVVHYVPDLFADKPVLRANRRYTTWVVLGLAIPAALGGVLTMTWAGALTGLLWGGLVRMLVVEQSMSALNSFLHVLGARPFPLGRDNSRNNPLLGILVWGEGWHNNHHAFPYSASFGLAWYRLDLGYWVIRLLAALGWAWDVQRPSRAQVAARRDRLALVNSMDGIPMNGTMK